MITKRDTIYTHVVRDSANAKTGKVTATYRNFASCPDDCAFHPDNGGGCYAEQPRISRVAERWGSEGWKLALEELEAQAPSGRVLRHHVIGDVIGTDGEPDWDYIEALNGLHERRPDVIPILYTHAWRRLGANPFTFPVNASCETLADVIQATELGYDTTLVVPEDTDEMLGLVIDGTAKPKRVVQCPFETRGVQCVDCKLCAKGDRTAVVAFVAHGSRKNKTKAAITARRNA